MEKQKLIEMGYKDTEYKQDETDICYKVFENGNAFIFAHHSDTKSS